MKTIIYISLLLCCSFLAGCGQPAGDGMSFFTDSETGCQYISRDARALTPRLDKNGYPMGCANR